MRQLMRARRAVVQDMRPPAGGSDPAKAAMVAKAKPGGALPGGAA